MEEQLAIPATPQPPSALLDHLWHLEIARVLNVRKARQKSTTIRCSVCGLDVPAIEVERPILTSYGDGWAWKTLNSYAHSRKCYFAAAKQAEERHAADPLDPWA